MKTPPAAPSPVAATVVLACSLILALCAGRAQQRPATELTGLQAGFAVPPDSVKPGIYWYWLSDNISREGVTRDLEAMARVGIGRAFIGNIGLDSLPSGPVKLFSDEWWAVLHQALKTAARLGIEIGIFNIPTLIYEKIHQSAGSFASIRTGTVLATILVVTAALIMYVQNRVLSRGRYQIIAGKSFRPLEIKLRGLRVPILCLCIGYIAFTILLPASPGAVDGNMQKGRELLPPRQFITLPTSMTRVQDLFGMP